VIRDILQVVKREWQWILLEKRYIVLVLVGPILFTLCLHGIYGTKKVVGLPVVFVDHDHSQLSREMSRAFLANEAFKSAGYINSPDEFPKLVAEDRAHVCVVFPYGMERNLKAGRGGRVEVMVDQSNFLSGSVELANANAVLTPFSVVADARIIEAVDGVKQEQALRRAMPIDVGTRVLFNPGFTSNYLNYIPVGAATISLQLAALLIGIRSGSSEFQERSFQPLPSVQANPIALVAGKVVSYLLPLLPIYLITLLIPHVLFGSPFVRTGLSFCVILVWFPAALITFGYGLSALTGDSLMATEVCALLTLPNFLVTGYTWPMFASPKAMLLFTYGMPLYPFAFAMKKITILGGTLADCINQIWCLTGWSLIAVLFAWAGTRRIFTHHPEGSVSHG
jgi:ABC-2 type transport system permease protein